MFCKMLRENKNVDKNKIRQRNLKVKQKWFSTLAFHLNHLGSFNTPKTQAIPQTNKIKISRISDNGMWL